MATSKGSQFQCPVCTDRLAYIGRDNEFPSEPLVFTCRNCNSFFRRAEPTGWVDNSTHYWQGQALKEGRSVRQDARLTATEINDILSHLRTLGSQNLTYENLQVLTGFVTVATLLQNLTSSRPSVRQRAAEVLMKHTFSLPPSKVDMNVKGVDQLVGQDLIARTEALKNRYQELIDKAQGANNAS